MSLRRRILITHALGLALVGIFFDACSSDDTNDTGSILQDASITIDVTTAVTPGDGGANDDASATDAAELDSGASSLPDAVKAAGYTLNTFSTLSFSSTNIDLGNTKKSGFAWYPWNLYSTTDITKIVPNTNGTVTLEGDTTGPGGEIVSGARTSATSFVGTAFGGGGYFEAVFAFDPAEVIDAGFHGGWPAWWSIPVDHVIESADTWWNADAASNYDNHIEPDFFEYDEPGVRYGGTLHNWYGVYGQTCETYCDWHTPSSVNDRNVPAGTDFTKFHSVGFLWVPATAATNGAATFFFDRVAVGTTTTWPLWENTMPPTDAAPQDPEPSWAIRWMDRAHLLLILGTAPKEPMTVKQVNVWQASAAENMHF